MQEKKTAMKNERKDKEDGGQTESAFGSSIALESFGFYSPADGSAKVWGLRKEKLRRQRSRQSEKRSRNYFRGNVWLQEHWEPEWGCALEERIGVMGDGGKWVCDFDKLTEGAGVAEHEIDGATGGRDSRSSGALDSGGGGCLVYSIGSNGEWSFEQEIYDRKKCEIHTFDHTLKKSIKTPSFLHFHSWGLGPPKTEGEEAAGQEGGEGQKVEGSTQGGSELLSLPEIVSRLGHRNRVIDILKVDVEGHEFAALLPLFLNKDPKTQEFIFSSPTYLPLIRQILIEVHIREKKPASTVGDAEMLLQGFADNGYVVFHKEPNIIAGGGRYTEYSLLRLNINMMGDN
eukprot:GHVS01034445.1.p1 GENE.GHVS01034445.1~~GHVS01034445.1.p1  ORF type:complete len:344 (+),score=47.30 GHVS01034445.1:246-1277(+)